MTEPEISSRPELHSGKQRMLIQILALMGLGLPLLLGWMLVGRAPSLSPLEVRQRMTEGKVRIVAVDTKVQTAFPNSTLWPTRELLSIKSSAEIPQNLQGQSLVLVCPGGIQSSLAARHLASIGISQVHSLRGGLQAWIVEGQDPSYFRPSPLLEQLAAVLTFFGVKFIYTLLAAALAVLLWRERATDLAALRRSMVAFFFGEAFCFVNVMFFRDQNIILEHFHSAGMVFSLALTVYALLEGLDARVIHFTSEERCAFQGLCQSCFKPSRHNNLKSQELNRHKEPQQNPLNGIVNSDAAPKYSKVPCSLRRVFLLSIPACIATAALPIFAPFQHMAYNTRILGMVHGYRHPAIHQIYELRFLPWAAILLFLACQANLLGVERRYIPISKVLFAAASGAMAFSYFRLVLVAVFAQNQVWFAAWEETSELIFVAMACGLLWLFRRGLFVSGHLSLFDNERSHC